MKNANTLKLAVVAAALFGATESASAQCFFGGWTRPTCRSTCRVPLPSTSTPNACQASTYRSCAPTCEAPSTGGSTAVCSGGKCVVVPNAAPESVDVEKFRDVLGANKVERPETLPESCVAAGKTTCAVASPAPKIDANGWLPAEIELLKLVNSERQKLKLAPLTLDLRQRDGARRVASRNARRGKAEHYGDNWGCAEVCTPGDDYREALSIWRTSQEHWDALTSAAFTRASVGVAQGRRTCFWTMRLF